MKTHLTCAELYSRSVAIHVQTESPPTPNWKNVLFLNTGDNHRGGGLSHAVPGGLIIHVMNLSLMHTCSLFYTIVLRRLPHHIKQKQCVYKKKKKATARLRREESSFPWRSFPPCSWLKMMGIFSSRIIAVCSLWTPQPRSTSQRGISYWLPFKIQSGQVSLSFCKWDKCKFGSAVFFFCLFVFVGFFLSIVRIGLAWRCWPLTFTGRRRCGLKGHTNILHRDSSSSHEAAFMTHCEVCVALCCAEHLSPCDTRDSGHS